VGALLILVAVCQDVQAQSPDSPPKRDVTKRMAQASLEHIISAPSSSRSLDQGLRTPLATSRSSRTKAQSEAVKALVRAREPFSTSSEDSARAVNPKVSAGKVKWHNDFSSALAASKTSGKPVLLFQMMGRLDDRFC